MFSRTLSQPLPGAKPEHAFASTGIRCTTPPVCSQFCRTRFAHSSVYRCLLSCLAIAWCLFAIAAKPAYADPPRQSIPGAGNTSEVQAFVNRGSIQAICGFTIASFIAVFMRRDSRRRRRNEYAWDLSYHPERVLIEEFANDADINQRAASELERRHIAADATWLFAALSAQGKYRIHSMLLAVSLVIGIAGIPSGIQMFRVNSALDAGRVQQAAGNIAAAEAEYRHAVKIDGSSIIAKSLLAETLYRQKRLNEMVPILIDVCAVSRPDSRNLIMLGDCFMVLHREDDAEEKYRMAAGGGALMSEAALKLSRCLQRQHRVEDSVRELRRLTRMDPKNVKAHAELGKALLSISFVDEGMEHLEHATALEPENVIGLRALADGYVNQGRFADAADVLHAALFLDPEYAEDYYNLGYVLKKLNDTKGALDAYQKYVAIRTHHYQPVKPVLVRADSPENPADSSSADPTAPGFGQTTAVHIRTAMAQLQSLEYTRRISMNQ